MTLTSSLMFRAAEELATQAHAGQVDKAGQPYILHPMRVAKRFHLVQEVDFAVVALLHDVVEDTHVTLNDLHRMFPTHIVAAVDAITHRKNEPRDAYYQRVKANPLAHRVKLADVDDNSDPERLASLDVATRKRLETKYAHARQALA